MPTVRSAIALAAEAAGREVGCPHRQFRRRLRECRRDHQRLRQFAWLPGRRAQHLVQHRLRADRRRRRGHAARQLVQRGAGGGRPRTTGGSRPQGGAAHAGAAGSALAADRRGAGAVRRGDGAFAGRPLPRRGLRRGAVSQGQFPAGQRGHAGVPGLVRHRGAPFLPRGFRSAAFDAEGVATRESPLVRGGIVQRYVLGSYSARKLGLQTTANAGGVHNLQVRRMPAACRNWCRAWAAACWSPS
jgi:hypothetical protein